ncbi:MAG: hypothetical protein ABSG25_01430 [Bryobacteraceae bacterium]
MPPVPSVPPKKCKEELLAEEVRSAMDLATRTLQWGVTLMISLQTALFFIRRDILNTFVDAGKLPKGSELPFPRYVMGTAFLLVVASILAKLGARNAQQYRHYKEQLAKSRQSGITDLPIKHTSRWMYVLYFVFPAIDILSRMYVDIRFQ